MLRAADPVGDRTVAQRILSAALDRRRTGVGRAYVPHPGELDWWLFHADPRRAPIELFIDEQPDDADGRVVVVDRDLREATLIGPLADLVPWVEHQLGDGPVSVAGISDHDVDAGAYLTERGYERGVGMTVYERALEPLDHSADAVRPVPQGARVRHVMGIGEADARADAARLSFASTMQPDVHRARYRRFMSSPAYVAERDVVALLPDASIGSFAIWWPDDRVGLAQFEPVGTRPDQQGRGLASAVLGTCMVAMVARGMRHVRVCTDDDRTPAKGLYVAMGFTLVDHLAWWNRAARR